jgi:hypothetical protein
VLKAPFIGTERRNGGLFVCGEEGDCSCMYLCTRTYYGGSLEVYD